MLNNLNDIALFVAVVKAKSFRKAADVLDMPTSTLSRRVSHLEKSIGIRLLHRTTRQIELTELGRTYFERCQGIIAQAQSAHEELSHAAESPSGMLRLWRSSPPITSFLTCPSSAACTRASALNSTSTRAAPT
jgi:DNA-binding transcriptional LysR family regulator